MMRLLHCWPKQAKLIQVEVNARILGLSRRVDVAIPAGSIVNTDIGNNSSRCNAFLKFTYVRQRLAALGAKIGRPKPPVFTFQGDGAYGISGLAEVMTAVRGKIPVIAVVANNFEWGAEKKNQIDYYDNRFVGSNLPDNPDYARLAEDMGAKGFRVEDYRDVPEVVREAVMSNRPCVINALIEGGEKVLAEPFRRDALKKPVRLLSKYRHLTVQ